MGNASSLFYNSDVEKTTLHRRITPSAEQFEEQQERWNALAEFLATDLQERSGYPISTWLQGSYKFATQVRGARLGEEFDIDMGVYYRWSGESGEGSFGARELKELAQRGLRAFESDDVIEVVTPPKKRCCRIRFKGGFHVDVPTYHLEPDADTRELATEDDQWEKSDPKALYLWFRDRFEDSARTKVRRQIRYLKIWTALKFREIAARPSSTLLTVLVAEAFDETQHTLDDDDCLLAVLDSIVERLERDRRVPNPVDSDEDLASRLDDQNFDAWLKDLRNFRALAEKALSADDLLTAADKWSEAFEHFFPLPDDVGLELKSIGGALPVKRATPIVHVEAVSRNNRNLQWSGTNKIGPIPKDCSIRFVVTNPGQLPPYSTIEWMVRNDGEEAESTSDLGHRAGSSLTAEEKSAYKGTHHMDCVVKQHGVVVGIQRGSGDDLGNVCSKEKPHKTTSLRQAKRPTLDLRCLAQIRSEWPS